MSLTAAGIGKAVTSGIAGGSALILAAAAAMGEIPMPGEETVTHSVFGLLMAYMYYDNKKKERSEPAPPPTSTAPPVDWPKALLDKMDLIDGKLDQHLIAFASFTATTNADIKNQESRLNRLSGEIVRPK